MSADLNRDVGLVVIGRNEARRLEQSLPGLDPSVRDIVYVDSGSSDDSIAVAKSNGAVVVELDRSTPFTAARARNAGFARLMQVAPGTSFVQFIDGDCLLEPGWISEAVQFLASNPTFAAVCGRRQEERPERNRFHMVTDMEWDTPIGETDYFGGDVMIRTAALASVGGYRDDLIAGEEPELCVRLRRAGWRIQRLDRLMTHHDIQMDSCRQWWRRSMRAGHAFAEGAALHAAGPERHWRRERRSIVVWGLVLPFVALALAWWTSGWSLVALALALGILFLKATRSVARRGVPVRNAALYAAHCVASKAPQAIGAMRYWTRRGARPRIIEYRSRPVAGSSSSTFLPVASEARLS
jgi:GT2 family glycosyltransferase